MSFDFDIALSFAGEERAYAERVAHLLRDQGVKVFYDRFEEAVLWGKDLYAHLTDVYRCRARFTVIFISAAYGQKLWTNQELRAAQARAFQEAQEYILPARFDDTEIPGVLPTTGYISLAERTPEDLAALILRKLTSVNDSTSTDFVRKDYRAVESPRIVNPAAMPPQVMRPQRRHSTVDFAERFAQAFPGLRGIAWYDDRKAVNVRIQRLLEEPLVYPDGDAPIWWWRDGNEHIETFKWLHDDLYLMNDSELKIKRMAGINTSGYSRKFVYVELSPMPATGLYRQTEARIAEVQRGEHHLSYYWEEFGIVDGEFSITREELDDGAAEINGQLQDVRGRAELRVRYVTPYNFLIAAHESPINNDDFDCELVGCLDSMLKGDDRLAELAKTIGRLPVRRFS